MTPISDAILSTIQQRSSGQGAADVGCQAPYGHLLREQATKAALDAGTAAGKACLEANAAGADPAARVVVHFADPLQDLPYSRFEGYQTHEIIAVWQPTAKYQSQSDYDHARHSLVERLQPLVLLHAFEGDANEWRAVAKSLGISIHDLSMTMDEAFDLAVKDLDVSKFNRYLTDALAQDRGNFRGLPQQLLDGVLQCSVALVRVPPVDHESYQRRMARLPDDIAQGIGGIVGSVRAQEIGEAVYARVANANTPMDIKLSRKRSGQRA